MGTTRKLADGCCSAISPCAHQQRDPYSLCDICDRAQNGERKPTSVHPMQQLPVLSAEEAKEQKLTYADLPKPDMVHQPAHYSRWKMQPIEFIAINDLTFWLANLIKYAMRYDAKDGLQDLYKARTYLDMQIRKVEGHHRFWEKPVEEERKLNAGK